jgi:hypothetical protein
LEPLETALCCHNAGIVHEIESNFQTGTQQKI